MLRPYAPHHERKLHFLVTSFTVIRQAVGRSASKAFEPDIPYVIA